MLRSRLRWPCLVMLLLTSGFAVAQSEFSAEIVDHSAKGNTNTTKVYFGKDKMRFDSAGSGNRGQAALFWT